MNIPPKYEDVVAQLDAALGREAALREELENRPDISIKKCIFEGENADGSKAFEYETLDGVLKKLTKINLEGWVCYGPAGENASVSLQQRLTVAEKLLQRVHQADALSHCSPLWKAIDAALKPADECPHCDTGKITQKPDGSWNCNHCVFIAPENDGGLDDQ